MTNDASRQHDISLALSPEIELLLEEGRTRRVVVLPGAEGANADKKPYARTHVEIVFKDEENLRKCVALLHWSDERLRKLPELLAKWQWDKTEREFMTIYFGTSWYSKSFFEERQNAFLERSHESYYAKFGAKVEDLKTRHEVLGAGTE